MKPHHSLLLLALLLPLVASAQVNSGSDGSDGAFNPTQSVTINMANHPNGIYQYTTINIPSGVTVTFTPNGNNTPVTWLAQGDCVINGSVDVSGRNAYVYQGSGSNLGGPGGGAGGNGGTTTTGGLGPGGGNVGTFGGNASFGASGAIWTNNNGSSQAAAGLYMATFLFCHYSADLAEAEGLRPEQRPDLAEEEEEVFYWQLLES